MAGHLEVARSTAIRDPGLGRKRRMRKRPHHLVSGPGKSVHHGNPGTLILHARGCEGQGPVKTGPIYEIGISTRGGYGHTSVLITSAVIDARPLFARAQHGALGHHTGGHKPPQRDHQLARHRHNVDPPYPAFEGTDTVAEPLAQFAVGLMLHPQPGQLDGNRTRTSITGFADALLAPALATVVGRTGKPEITADQAAVVKRAVERLVIRLLTADRANPLKTDQMTDLGFRRALDRTAQRLRADAFKLLHLLVGQAQSRMFTHDLLLEPCRQRAAIASAHLVEAGDEVPLQRHDITDALPMQQSLDAIVVGRAFLSQPIALTHSPLAVLLFRVRDMQHAADPWLTTQKGPKRWHQFVQVAVVGLGAPGL